jgi:hypothetical protein
VSDTGRRAAGALADEVADRLTELPDGTLTEGAAVARVAPRDAVPGWPLWRLVNLAGYRRFFEVAGHQIEFAARPFLLKPGANYAPTSRTRRPLYGRLQGAVATHLGILHSWVLARPHPH